MNTNLQLTHLMPSYHVKLFLRSVCNRWHTYRPGLGCKAQGCKAQECVLSQQRRARLEDTATLLIGIGTATQHMLVTSTQWVHSLT